MGLLLLPRRIAFLPTGRALIGFVLTAEAVGVARRRRLIAGGRLGQALTRRLAGEWRGLRRSSTSGSFGQFGFGAALALASGGCSVSFGGTTSGERSR